MSDNNRWLDEGWIDLGHDCAYKPFDAGVSAYDEHEPGREVIGIFFRHPSPRDPERSATPGYCVGTVPITGPRAWTVESLDPLTLSPSILCEGTDCGGAHGYIRAGRWEPC